MVPWLIKQSEKSFDFWSPNKGTISHTFMKLLFRLMNASFRKMETVIYLENLEGYFALFGIEETERQPSDI